ncbi:MAG TPA: hypothetical protein VMR23_13455 [Candidatus Limnocylindria bacterium]|nr:hypothetical protein [Candidatus Limnocylindria bacterium]
MSGGPAREVSCPGCGAAVTFVSAASLLAVCGPVHLAHADLSGFSLFKEAYHWGRRAGAHAAANLGRPLDASIVRP